MPPVDAVAMTNRILALHRNKKIPEWHRSLQILSFGYQPNEQELKLAHRKLSLLVHPDKNPSPDVRARIDEPLLSSHSILCSSLTSVRLVGSVCRRPTRSWRSVRPKPF